MISRDRVKRSMRPPQGKAIRRPGHLSSTLFVLAPEKTTHAVSMSLNSWRNLLEGGRYAYTSRSRGT
jgi:hypothetical protein